MKLLVDSSVIIDLFDLHRPNARASLTILDECQIGNLQGYFAAFSTPTIIYVLRKKFPKITDQQLIVAGITSSLQPVDLPSEDLYYPFEHQFIDYEDGLQAAAAARCRADYIITHNLKDFAPSPIPPITPEDFVKNIIISPK